MKLQSLKQLGLNRSKKPREPLMSLVELAKQLDVTTNQLRGYLGSSTIPAPKAVFKTHSSVNDDHKNKPVSLYSPSEFKKWWKAYQVQIKKEK